VQSKLSLQEIRSVTLKTSVIEVLIEFTSILSFPLTDISDCAVIVLTDSAEKHDRVVYEMGAEALSNEERAAIFSKVLGRPIKYEQQSLDDFYKQYTSYGISHGVVYNLASYALNGMSKTITPQLAIVLGRPLGTLEAWIKKNVQAFK
jgi:hypothetical protein